MNMQEQIGTQKERVILEDDSSYITAEFNALRSEVLKRIEIKHQLTSLALVAPGTILAVGFQAKNAFLMFSYPILACFLLAVWLANSHKLFELAGYIRKLESRVGENNIGWEHFGTRTPTPKQFRFIGFLGSGAIFICTQLLTLFAGLTFARFDIAEKILLSFSITSIVLSIAMLVVLEARRVPFFISD